MIVSSAGSLSLYGWWLSHFCRVIGILIKLEVSQPTALSVCTVWTICERLLTDASSKTEPREFNCGHCTYCTNPCNVILIACTLILMVLSLQELPIHTQLACRTDTRQQYTRSQASTECNDSGHGWFRSSRDDAIRANKLVNLVAASEKDTWNIRPRTCRSWNSCIVQRTTIHAAQQNRFLLA